MNRVLTALVLGYFIVALIGSCAETQSCAERGGVYVRPVFSFSGAFCSDGKPL